ncbi:PREDICTED: uncharacterized protein LOC109590980 [Amphimedon queenslandica]|uniref:Translocation protein SEC62 n=1 Tax=Amphimedon queenslandica TaxID=400682 RepID=A0AAN0JZE7_AMPQE|nr:PREDICTED: uncharacterized protein LOC109590980 [Amphimedon queenslandica]|eukprot:XP_019862365.1 PREDICTED: uncharacterized protein LOC109590980 [Amphimedon queenslandica]
MKRNKDSNPPLDMNDEEDDKDKKEFQKILIYLRKKVPCKGGQIKKEKVNYITGSKLIDTLMSSQWGEGGSDGDDSPHFTSRASAIQYCKRLIDGGYLVGGKKIEMKLDKKGDDDEEDTSTDSKDSKKVST